MRRSSGALAFVTLALMLGVTGLASAQGKGGGGGGGGNAGTAAGALYGDLYVIERDGAGVPITRNVSYTDAETGGTVTAACVQPLAASCGKLPLWGECGKQLPAGVLPLPACVFDPELYDPCAVYESYTDQIQEVKFGRESVSRAPATVIDKSYAEALKGLNSAAANHCDCVAATPPGSCQSNDEGELKDTRAIRLDPAGRLTLCLASETGGYAWKTIDAPLENLGLYRATMTNGCFGKVTEETVGEEGVRVVVTTALDPSGIYYLRESDPGGKADLSHLVCPYPQENWSEGWEAQEAGCTVQPDPVGGTPGPACWWESPTTPTVTTPGKYVDASDMLRAAVFIAAGADKSSPVTLDEIVNVNNYLGVNVWTYTTNKKTKTLTINYFPFTENAGATLFQYARGSDACNRNHDEAWASLLTAALDPTSSFSIADVNVFAGSPPGVDLDSVDITVCRGGFKLRETAQPPANDSPLIACKNGSDDLAYGCGGANWFAQAAEDARKTIWYLHNWRVPELAY